MEKPMAAIKSKREIVKITHACKITDEIFEKIIKNFNFRNEKSLSLFIKKEIRHRGLKPSFRAIVAAGKNAAHPHHKPTNAILKGFVVIDFGVVYQDYMSDMTRTVYVGTPNKAEIKIYNLLLRSQKIGLSAVKNGAKCKEVDLKARNSLGKFKKYFIHGLGHGVGRRIHEMPRVSFKSRFFLKRGMIITIEPGIYIKKQLGIRIEDTCVVTKSGTKVLTKSKKSLLIFEKIK